MDPNHTNKHPPPTEPNPHPTALQISLPFENLQFSCFYMTHRFKKTQINMFLHRPNLN